MSFLFYATGYWCKNCDKYYYKPKSENNQICGNEKYIKILNKDKMIKLIVELSDFTVEESIVKLYVLNPNDNKTYHEIDDFFQNILNYEKNGSNYSNLYSFILNEYADDIYEDVYVKCISKEYKFDKRMRSCWNSLCTRTTNIFNYLQLYNPYFQPI